MINTGCTFANQPRNLYPCLTLLKAKLITFFLYYAMFKTFKLIKFLSVWNFIGILTDILKWNSEFQLLSWFSVGLFYNWVFHFLQLQWILKPTPLMLILVSTRWHCCQSNKIGLGHDVMGRGYAFSLFISLPCLYLLFVSLFNIWIFLFK